jgi:nucleotide-binding universal stress UspA family protein
LNDALPLLEELETGTVMFVRPQRAGARAAPVALERATSHLHRHGVNAVSEETMRGGLAVSDILLSRAADLAADLIVAGVTMPVLMSH